MPGCRTVARSRSAPTARRAWSRSTGCRSTSTSSTRQIPARPGRRRSAHSRGSSTTAWSRASASATSTARSWTRPLELAPIAAVQVAHQPVRRPGAPRRRRRSVRRARNHGDRPLAARRATPRAQARAARGAGEHRASARGDGGRGRARLAARPRAERRRRSRRPPARDCSLVRARRGAPPRSRRARASRADTHQCRRGQGSTATSSSSWASPVPGSHASPPSTSHAGTSGSTGTSAAARSPTSPSPSTRRWRQDRARSSSTTRTSPAQCGATSWRRQRATGSRHAASGSTRRSRRRRSTSSSACSIVSDALPSPEELKEAARTEAGLLSPTQQMRAFRELEPPTADEGFAAVERVAVHARPARWSARASSSPLPRSRRCLAQAPIAARRTSSSTGGRAAAPPISIRAWRPPRASSPDRSKQPSARTPVARRSAGAALPLPGLPLAFARTHEVDPARSILVGTSRAHRTLASALGARYVDVSP